MPTALALVLLSVAAIAVGSPMPPCHARAHTTARSHLQNPHVAQGHRTDDDACVVAATVAQQSNMRKIVPVMHPMEENHPRFEVTTCD